jgi:glyoxylase-like metal-dependent hydrolase (beta-lactamase superfamily II)
MMVQQIAVADEAVLSGIEANGVTQISSDVAYQRLGLVNVIYVGEVASDSWFLIDAGLAGTARAIIRAAEARFGEAIGPGAIILTHGHFDHVGALEELLEKWKVPVFAHSLEQPYLDGSRSYPPPDPSVGGGLMSTLARFYPRGPIDVRKWLEPLAVDGSVPRMSGWQWIPTPGHTPGHVSLWRERDSTLIAGDAFITTAQESAYAVVTQQPELHGPPMYYTTDWDHARASVARLAALQPEVVITGHGPPMSGPQMLASLRELVDKFDMVAIPRQGRYVNTPRMPK